MHRALFHAFLEVEKTLVHAVETLVGKLVHVIKSLVHTLYELAKLSRSHVRIFSHDYAFPPDRYESCQPL